jgi:hypothetical protein
MFNKIRKFVISAKEELDQVLAFAKTDADLFYYRGVIQLNLHNYFEALEDFEEVIFNNFKL